MSDDGMFGPRTAEPEKQCCIGNGTTQPYVALQVKTLQRIPWITTYDSLTVCDHFYLHRV